MLLHLNFHEGLMDEMDVILYPKKSWKNLPGFNARWELLDHIYKQFPYFHLEDKMLLTEGG